MGQRRQTSFWVPLVFGLMGIARAIGNPRLAAVRPVDIVQLIATGMCLGAALAMIFTYFHRRRQRESA